MSGQSRWLLYILIIPVLLLLVAALLLRLILDEEKVLEMAAGALKEQTGATLAVEGESAISLFPTLGVDLREANLALPGEKSPSLHARSLVIGVQLLPLISRRIAIDTIGLDGLLIRIQRAEPEDRLDTSGLSNEQLDAFYRERREALEQRAADTAGEALTVPLDLYVERLTVTDARIETAGPGADESSVVEVEKLQAFGLNLAARPVPVELRLRLPGDNPVKLRLDGTLAMDQAAQRATVDKLHLRVEGATAEPLELRARGEVDVSRQIADLALELTLGEMRGDGQMRYASFESPQIDASLQLNLFDPVLLALAGPQAAAGPGRPEAGGDRPLPLDAIRAVDSRAELAIERALFGVHSITNLAVAVRARDGLVTVQPAAGTLYDGTIDLQATFDGRYNTAKLATSGSVEDVDVAAALSAMETGVMLTGTARGEWQLTSAGRTAEELVTGLTGPINANVDQAVLEDLGVEKMLCEAVALVNRDRMRAELPDSSQFRDLSMTITLGEGEARLKPLRAELPHLSLSGNGRLDLASKAFKSEFKARLSPGLGELDPACEVSKRLTSIDWPVECKGQITGDPGEWCAVDTEEIIEDLAKYEVQRKVEKKAGKLLDKLFD